MNKKTFIFLLIIAVLFLALVLYFTPSITPVELKLDTVKLDSEGTELGTVELVMVGSKLDYLFQPSRMDLYIHPFDGITSISPTNSVTKFGEIPGMIQSHPSQDYLYASYGGIEQSTVDMIFATLGFSPDLTMWIFCNNSDRIYYVASVSGECSTAELVEYFTGLIHF